MSRRASTRAGERARRRRGRGHLFGRATIALPLLALVLIATSAPSAAEPTPTPAEPARSPSGESVSVLYGPSLAHLIADRIAPEFTRATGIRVDGEPQRSLADMRVTTASGAPADVAVVTDVDLLNAKLTSEQAPLYVVFAANAMVVGYRKESTYGKAIAAGVPWFDALHAGGVRFGRLDPNLDPLGQRTVFVLQLARLYYQSGDLVAQILRPDQIVPASELVAKLQRGELDVALLYRSQAVEAGLSLMDLPIEINLADPGRRGVYEDASLEVHGDLLRAGPIVVAAVPLAGAPHRAAALRFVDFLSTSTAMRIIDEDGFVVPPGFPFRRPWGQEP